MDSDTPNFCFPGYWKMKETIQGTGSWGPEPPGPGIAPAFSSPRRERLRWPPPPKPRLKSGGGFGPDTGSGTTVPPGCLPVPRAAFDASAREEEEENPDDEGEGEEGEAAAWRPPPRWAQLGASQGPRPPSPTYWKTCLQRRPHRAVSLPDAAVLREAPRCHSTASFGVPPGPAGEPHTPQGPPFTPGRGCDATGALPLLSF